MPYFKSKFDNKNRNFWAQGRNGVTDKITALIANLEYRKLYDRDAKKMTPDNHGVVQINVLTSRGEELNAGFLVPLEAFIDIAKQVLESEGYKVEE